MRPPDENQNGSTRPNFMSASRRAAGSDDNILARLERDAKRGAAGKSWRNHTRLAWCALASLAVIGLIGVLASLARENLAVHRQPMLIEAKAVQAEPYGVSGAPSMAAKSGFAPLPAPAPSMKMAAASIDMPSERSWSKAYEPASAPPMVMLKPVAAPTAKAAAAPAPKPTAARSASPPKPAAKNSPAKPAPSGPATPSRSAVATAPVRPAVVAAPSRSIAAAAPVRAKRAAPAASPARAEPAAVDSDVALLSAIIMHASRHAAERAQMEAAQCGAGKKCPPNDAAAALKATD